MKTKSLFIFGSAALLIAVLLTGYFLFDNYNKKKIAQFQLQNEKIDFLNTDLHQRDSLVNDYMAILNQIEADIKYIKEQENILETQSNDPEFGLDQKTRIVEDIRLVSSLLEENKAKISKLNKKLKDSGIEINSLNEKITLLSQTIEERDKSIESLVVEISKKDEELSELTQIIAKVEDSVKFQQKIIDHQTNQLNKAYIASGNFKELKEKNIVIKDGGFLGLGKTKTLEEDLSNEYFTMVDITKTKSFPLFSKEAELITEHPAGSYEWITENDTVTYMIVLNPDEFWKISKYAVVETK
jgi:Tfp pilus assembly protein PilN